MVQMVARGIPHNSHERFMQTRFPTESKRIRRSDLRLFARALRDGWDIPQPVLNSGLAMVRAVLADADASDRKRKIAIEAAALLEIHDSN